MEEGITYIFLCHLEITCKNSLQNRKLCCNVKNSSLESVLTTFLHFLIFSLLDYVINDKNLQGEDSGLSICSKVYYIF